MNFFLVLQLKSAKTLYLLPFVLLIKPYHSRYLPEIILRPDFNLLRPDQERQHILTHQPQIRRRYLLFQQLRKPLSRHFLPVKLPRTLLKMFKMHRYSLPYIPFPVVPVTSLHMTHPAATAKNPCLPNTAANRGRYADTYLRRTLPY